VKVIDNYKMAVENSDEAISVAQKFAETIIQRLQPVR